MAGLRGGGYGEDGGEDGGVGTSSGRFNISLLVGGLLGLKASSKVSPRDTSLQGLPSMVRGSRQNLRFAKFSNIKISVYPKKTYAHKTG